MCSLRDCEAHPHRGESTHPLSSPTCSEVGESHGSFVETYCYAGYQDSTIQVKSATRPSLELYSLINDCREINWTPTIRALMNLPDCIQSFLIFEPNNSDPIFKIERTSSCTWVKQDRTSVTFGQCDRCIYYHGDRLLHCAVHPNGPNPDLDSCPDFEAKNNPSVGAEG